MARRMLCLALAIGLTGAPPALTAQATATDPEVAKGIKLVDDGDYDGAILTLDNAARRLAVDPAKAKDLSQAFLYLGIAYVGKGHEAAARAKFRDALAQIKDLTLSPDKFPPKVIDVFEAARQEASRAPAAPAAPKKKGGSGKLILIGAGVAAIGGGVAVAAGGGSSKPTDSRITETFTGSLCGTEACDQYRDFDIVVGGTGTLDATATWTEGGVFFELLLQDGNYAEVARSNRTTNTSSQLTGGVTPQNAQNSCAGCTYHLSIGRGDGDARPVPFTLTVRHP